MHRRRPRPRARVRARRRLDPSLRRGRVVRAHGGGHPEARCPWRRTRLRRRHDDRANLDAASIRTFVFTATDSSGNAGTCEVRVHVADADECTDGSHTCNTGALCENLYDEYGDPGELSNHVVTGTYQCTCPVGYAGDGYSAPCIAPSCLQTVSNNNDANNRRSTNNVNLVTLANGDTVWSQYQDGGSSRSLGSAFDSQVNDWDHAWHTTEHDRDTWSTTPLQMHYTFTAGDRLVEGVKVWQVPGNGHQAGRIDVKYWQDGIWVVASGQSPTGLTSLAYLAEETINIEPVTTNKIRLDIYSHAQASDNMYLGLAEIQILGCE
jgi:hypothetical protein